MVELRAFAHTDIALLQRWLFEPHVRAWYEHPDNWLCEVRNKDGAFDWIHHFVILFAGRPVGFCQYYEYRLGGETWHGNLDVTGAYSIDYLIGESEYLRRGVCKAAVCAMLYKIRQIDGATMVIVQPDEENAASRALLSACGFTYDGARKLFRYDFYKQGDENE